MDMINALKEPKKIELTFRLNNELADILPRIAELLGVKKEEVHVVDDSWSIDYMNHSKTKDVPIHREFTKDLPFIKYHGIKRSYFFKGRGIIMYQARNDESLKYIVYHTQRYDGSGVYFYFVPHGKLFRLRRHIERQNKKAIESRPPILEPGLLEKVIENTVGFLLRKKEIQKYDVKIKRGVLLDGSPGNGKTMLCKWIQHLCSQNSIGYRSVTPSEIDAAYEKNYMSDLFNSEGITFYDDIDISYLNRRSGNGKVACSILSAMDGLDDAKFTVRIFTTNEPVDSLDAAFTRPGRIDCCFRFEKPSADLRARLINSWNDEIKSSIDANRLVNVTDGSSFADLEAIKTYLVMNKLTGDKTWNLDYALEQFEIDRKLIQKARVKRPGFGSR